MKKRLLASLLSLCLLTGLIPTAALAAEDDAGDALSPDCICEALCTENEVDGNCPVCSVDSTACLGIAPEGSVDVPVELECAGLAGCVDGVHDAAGGALLLARAREAHGLAVHIARRAARHVRAHRGRAHAARREFGAGLRETLLAFVHHTLSR